MGIGRELEAQRSDGSTVPVEVSLGPVRFEQGPWVMAVVRDISERKQLRSWAALRHEVQRQLDDRGPERDLELASVDGHEDRQTQIALYRVG